MLVLEMNLTIYPHIMNSGFVPYCKKRFGGLPQIIIDNNTELHHRKIGDILNPSKGDIF